MNLFFNHSPSLRSRFFIAVLIAISIIVSDSQLGIFSQIRMYLDTVTDFFYSISNRPRQFIDIISTTLSSRDRLELENQSLRQELLLKKSDLMMLDQYKRENECLRALLDSPVRQDEQRMLAKVITTLNDPYSNQVVIDKGSINGVYEGQPLISEKGIIGQVITVAKSTSRVLLICDAAHSLPIQVLRNNIRMIATGSGCSDTLNIEYMSSSNDDIRIGDILVTSGLDGRFPEGYPVAVVSSIELDAQRAHLIIRARPKENLRCLRYLLLLFRSKKFNKDRYLISEEVHHIENMRSE